MKFRITPFSIVWAIALVYTIYFWIENKIHPPYPGGGMLEGLFWDTSLLVFTFTFVSDLIFRFTIKSLKTIWIVETILVVITAVVLYFNLFY